jgi:TonB family protein
MWADLVLQRGWLSALITICCVLSAFEDRAADTSSVPARYAAWAAPLSKRLHLGPAQEAAFDRTLAAFAPTQATAEDLVEKLRAMTGPERIDYMVSQLESSLEKTRVLSREMHAFYSLLTIEQRKILDEALRPAVPPEGPPDNVSAKPIPTEPNLQLPSHTDPKWRIQPNADDIGRVYPAAALKAKVKGRVMMSCETDDEGYLAQCVIKEETPSGYGFGNAALEISAYMRMTPATNYGVPTQGEVDVPINFDLEN